MADHCPTLQSHAWMPQPSDEAEDVDEPPENRKQQTFQRTTVRRVNDQSSLLTKAIKGQSDDEAQDVMPVSRTRDNRRRSMASNISIASTADLTSDTGLTSPSRTNTPSPPIPEMAMLRLDGVMALKSNNLSALNAQNSAQGRPALEVRKRSIQFACGAEPPRPQAVPMQKTTSAQEVKRRPCIKFACQARPSSTQNTPPNKTAMAIPRSVQPEGATTSSMKLSQLTTAPPSPRSAMPRKSPNRLTSSRPKFIRANSIDLDKDGSQFHEFARDKAREDDWIRQENPAAKTKLTINDTLSKENTFRRLAAEAEEEAEMEEEEAEEDNDEDDEDEQDELDDDEDNEEEEDDDNEEEEDDSDLDVAGGYSTDEETGFAASESEEEEDENMILWTPRSKSSEPKAMFTPLARQPSAHDQHSDSSSSNATNRRRSRGSKSRRSKPEDNTPDLPDSTDFVCGTLDEDRPLEEAYISCLTARRNEKLRVIPQDIDPSFPTSDPENEEEEEIYNPVHHSSDEEDWLPGKMEGVDTDQARARRRRRSDTSPGRKYHSPAPKRHHSPAPKRHHSPPPKRHLSPAPKRQLSPAPTQRVRSPKPLFDRHSPRRAPSPAPRAMTTPTGSPRLGAVKFQLAGRPGLIQTKSLPRPAAFFTHVKHSKHQKQNVDADTHVRGAIDIVKGLEKKRQRRREKFHQKYFDRARRGQIPERKPMPGRGAERMKELGLLMAGKKDQGNYVLSI
ncbi:hypothetical protein B0I35DRAFT_43817 [Stachybotrys elegans]|uniref:Uncharacterized protein n=1 Tax=Stachybotrys elegans TaxID=80388 RepID=A0A8K0WX60_9HYPO|nr:hypothetical protein B0I35DRAFT_43817 [Stachybotrys elegans]